MELFVSTLEQLKCRDAYAAVKAVLPALEKPLERGLRYHTRAQETLPTGRGRISPSGRRSSWLLSRRCCCAAPAARTRKKFCCRRRPLPSCTSSWKKAVSF